MSINISNCKWNTTVCNDISNCCPKPIVCKDGTCGTCCKCCDLQYIKNGVIECEKPNIYNTPYYFQNLENPYYPGPDQGEGNGIPDFGEPGVNFNGLIVVDQIDND